MIVMRVRLAASALTFALALAFAPEATADGSGSRIDYVALGDSYSAGNGTPDASGECRRGDHAYPALLSHRMGASTFKHLACSGADTDEIREKQLTAISSATDMVTLTAGGNDGELFTAVVIACALNPVDALCARAARMAGDYIAATLPRKLDRLYSDLKSRLAGGATVLAGGYPALYEPVTTAGECGALAPDAQRRAAMNTTAERLNREIRSAVSRAAKSSKQTWKFVPAAFDGHSLCSEDPWVNGMGSLVADMKAAWHPNADGHRNYRDQFMKALTEKP
jgi:lysophospholipase L1-like esterase